MKKNDPAKPVKPGASYAADRHLNTQGGNARHIEDAHALDSGDLRLPHEHDEGPKPGPDKQVSSTPLPRQVIEQAASDITRGLRDTEQRGVPFDVPAPGPHPEQTLGGEVPMCGIDAKSTASRNEILDREKKVRDAKK